jgi:hypothetical protein
MARNYKSKIRCDLPFVQHFVLQPIERLILIILSIIFLALIGYAAMSVPVSKTPIKFEIIPIS